MGVDCPLTKTTTRRLTDEVYHKQAGLPMLVAEGGIDGCGLRVTGGDDTGDSDGEQRRLDRLPPRCLDQCNEPARTETEGGRRRTGLATGRLLVAATLGGGGDAE